MREGVSFFTTGRTRRLPVTLKFWRSAVLKNRAAIGFVGAGVRDGGNRMTACATFGAGVVNDDLGANHNAQEPPEANVGGGKGIQATT